MGLFTSTEYKPLIQFADVRILLKSYPLIQKVNKDVITPQFTTICALNKIQIDKRLHS